MAIDAGRQYRPVTSNETNANASLSVRVLRHLERGVNNYSAYVAKFPVVAQPCMPSWKSHANTLQERVVMPFGGTTVAGQFSAMDWFMCHKRSVGVGNTTWRLYAGRHIYTGDANIDTTRLSRGYQVANMTTSANTWSLPAPVQLGIDRDRAGETWLTLTAENSDNSTRGEISMIAVVPRAANIDI